MVLQKSLRMEILKPYISTQEQSSSTFKKKFIVAYLYCKLLGTFPYALQSQTHQTKAQLDYGVASTLLHALVILITIQQNLTNSMKKLNLLEKLQLEAPQNTTSNPAEQMRIFLAKFTDKTDYVAMSFFLGAFLISIKMASQMFSLQSYFDQLDQDIEDQKRTMTGVSDVFNVKKLDPTFKRSLVIWSALMGMVVGAIITSWLMEPKRAVPLSELHKFCKAFIKLASITYCLQFCVFCSMLEYHFFYINSVLKRMLAVEKVWQEPWFNGVLGKVGIWHRTLTHTLEQINRMNQLQNLLSVISCTINLLPHLFLVGIRLLGSADSKDYSVIQFALAMRYLMKIGLRCYYASLVTYEANKTKMHLCRFLMQRNDPQLLEQIKIILQQMSCGDTNFRLCGLVNLNNSFFLATMLAVVGYFIIILQSYMSEIDSDN